MFKRSIFYSSKILFRNFSTRPSIKINNKNNNYNNDKQLLKYIVGASVLRSAVLTSSNTPNKKNNQ